MKNMHISTSLIIALIIIVKPACSYGQITNLQEKDVDPQLTERQLHYIYSYIINTITSREISPVAFYRPPKMFPKASKKSYITITTNASHTRHVANVLSSDSNNIKRIKVDSFFQIVDPKYLATQIPVRKITYTENKKSKLNEVDPNGLFEFYFTDILFVDSTFYVGVKVNILIKYLLSNQDITKSMEGGDLFTFKIKVCPTYNILIFEKVFHDYWGKPGPNGHFDGHIDSDKKPVKPGYYKETVLNTTCACGSNNDLD